MEIEQSTTASPIGEVWWAARAGAVVALGFEVQVATLRARVSARFPGEAWLSVSDAGGARAAIEGYFGGDLWALDALDVDASGTPFQARVWKALRAIPLGTAISYAELAREIGEPRAVRAVGSANAKNPVSLIVPCHRVIGAAGDLRGYAGGVPRKRWLLDHERGATA